jgi:hypothetical protein
LAKVLAPPQHIDFHHGFQDEEIDKETINRFQQLVFPVAREVKHEDDDCVQQDGHHDIALGEKKSL